MWQQVDTDAKTKKEEYAKAVTENPGFDSAFTHT